MRRLGLVVAVLAAAGCSALRDAFTAHPKAAARAAGQTLSVERLAQLASRAKGMPLDASSLSRLADAYVDYALFAMAVVQGRNLDDSATIARAMWPRVSQLRFNHFFAGISKSVEPTPHQVDSTYAAGEVRAFQHILITVPPNAPPPEVERKQQQINAVWRGLVTTGGENFAAVARRRSEDEGSKPAGGYLGAGGRGRFVRPFEEAAWGLAPGQMSGVVRSAFGFHIIRRPPLAEIRDTFTADVAQVLETRLDSAYLSDLVTQHEVRVADDAPQAIRDAVQDLPAAAGSDKRLASYRGGTFTVKDFARWVAAVDPRFAQQLATANDSLIRLALDRVIERELALRQAESTQVSLPDSEWAAVRAEYDSTLALLRDQLRLDPTAVRDTSVPVTRRTQFVMAAVDAYFDRVVGGQAEYHSVPHFLAQTLREQADWSVDAAGVRSAIQRAVALRASADSIRPPGAGTPGLRPAPGPPPVGPAADTARGSSPGS